MEQEETLTKKERIEKKRDEEKAKKEKQLQLARIRKWIVISIMTLVSVVGIWWFAQASLRPLPGQSVTDLGRGHVPDETHIVYNSNPPTSGKHYAEWVKSAMYDKPQVDEMLVHSLEHGYIIISYTCDSGSNTQKIATESAMLSEKWTNQECKNLQKQLSDLLHEQRLWKLIVVSRPSLDVKIALTAWDRIDKMNELNTDEIIRFIDAFRDKGPEQTME